MADVDQIQQCVQCSEYNHYNTYRQEACIAKEENGFWTETPPESLYVLQWVYKHYSICETPVLQCK